MNDFFTDLENDFLYEYQHVVTPSGQIEKYFWHDELNLFLEAGKKSHNDNKLELLLYVAISALETILEDITNNKAKAFILRNGNTEFRNKISELIKDYSQLLEEAKNQRLKKLPKTLIIHEMV